MLAAVFRIRISFHADPDPKGVKIKETTTYTNKFSTKFFKIKLKHHWKLLNTNYYERILTYFQFCTGIHIMNYEPVYFLGFLTSWIRIQEAFLYAVPSPKHWFTVPVMTCFTSFEILNFFRILKVCLNRFFSNNFFYFLKFLSLGRIWNRGIKILRAGSEFC